jgi:hypothetical protein
MVPLSKRWTYVEAIVAIYFASEDDLRRFGTDEGSVRDACRRAFEGKEQPIDKRGLVNKINKLVRSIREAMPGVDALSKRHSVIWARWAFQDSPLPVSDHYIQRLARWKLATSGSQVMQYMHAETKKWTGPQWKPTGMDNIRGYLLDEVILGKVLSCDVYTVSWRMTPKKLLPHSDQVVVSNKERPTDKSPVPRGRDVTKVCGINAVTILGRVVSEAAKSRRFSEISAHKEEGRYQSSLSRTDLIKLLMRNYPILRTNYKAATLVRALSSFVQCPSGRPGGTRVLRTNRAATSSISPRRR